MATSAGEVLGTIALFVLVGGGLGSWLLWQKSEKESLYELSSYTQKCLKGEFYNELYTARTQARVRPLPPPSESTPMTLPPLPSGATLSSGSAAFDQVVDRVLAQCEVRESEKGLALFYLGSMDEPAARHR